MDKPELENKLTRLQTTGDREGEAAILIEIANHLLNKRKWPQAAESLAKAAAIYKEEGNTAAQAIAVAIMGAVYWEQAHIRKSIQRLQESLELLSAAGEPAGRAIVTALLGLARWRLGEQNEALAMIGEVLEEGTPVPEACLPLVRSMENARRQLENRLSGDATSGSPAKALQAHLALVPLLLCLGERGLAASHHRRAQALAREMDNAEALTLLSAISDQFKNFP